MFKRILFFITLTTILCFIFFKVWESDVINASAVSEIEIKNYNNLNVANHKTLTIDRRDNIGELIEELNDLEDVSNDIVHCELDFGERYLISVRFESDKNTITFDINPSCYIAVIDDKYSKVTNESLIKMLNVYSE